MPQTRYVASTSTGLHPTLRWLKGKGARGGAYEGANNDSRASACEGANDGCSGQGAGGACGEANGGARIGYKEGKADWRVGAHDDDGTHDGACGDANDGCSGQGAGGARNRASGGACTGCKEGRLIGGWGHVVVVAPELGRLCGGSKGSRS
jgi:hypothetical protein